MVQSYVLWKWADEAEQAASARAPNSAVASERLAVVIKMTG